MKRLREAYTPEQLAELYSRRYEHTGWVEHVRRVQVTIGFGKAMRSEKTVWSIADLSCGDGAISDGIAPTGVRIIRGDLTLGYEYSGPIEETIELIPHVDLFILSETLEHLDNPDAILRRIRVKADRLLLSTPCTENSRTDENPEHYWQWDSSDVKDMLEATGWTTDHLVLLGGPKWWYQYQIWGCS